MTARGDASGPDGRFLSDLLADLGIPADQRQRAAIAELLAAHPDLDDATLADLIAALLARGPRQQAALRRSLLGWLSRDAGDRTARPTAITPGGAAVPPSLRTPRPPAFPEDEPAPPGAPSEVARALRERFRSPWVRSLLSLLLIAMAASVIVPAVCGGTDACRGWKPAPADRRPDDRFGDLDPWTLLAVVAGSLVLVFLAQRAAPPLRAWWDGRGRTPEPVPPASATGSLRFAVEEVGGPLPPWFSRRERLALGRAVPRRPGSVPGYRLDVAASVRRTADGGGVPRPEYLRLPELPPVLVLAEEESAARTWSDLPAELAGALAASGIPAEAGTFRGTFPERAELAGGRRLGLPTLLNPEGLVLLVGDGTGLRRAATAGFWRDGQPDPAMLLRRLAATRRYAWLDEREWMMWDRDADPHLRIPELAVWPATTAGIEGALRQLGGERLSSPKPPARPVRPGESGTSEAATLAGILGDAAAWAAACAMLQPSPPALAERLRSEFFPWLPRAAFGRLAALPGTQVTQAGLVFATPLLVRLRRGFVRRLEEPTQEAILRRIAALVREAMPDAEGLARDTRRWLSARVLLEVDAPLAEPELLALSQTALRPAIREDYAAIARPGETGRGETRPGEPGAGDHRMPLRRSPGSGPTLFRLGEALGTPFGGPEFRPWSVLPIATGEVSLIEGRGVAAQIHPSGGTTVLLADGALVVASPSDAASRVFRVMPESDVSSTGEERDAEPRLALSDDGVWLAAAGPALGFAVMRQPETRGEGDGVLDRWPPAWSDDPEIMKALRRERPRGLAWGPSQRLVVSSTYEGLLLLPSPGDSMRGGTVRRMDGGRVFGPLAFGGRERERLFAAEQDKVLHAPLEALDSLDHVPGDGAHFFGGVVTALSASRAGTVAVGLDLRPPIRHAFSSSSESDVPGPAGRGAVEVVTPDGAHHGPWSAAHPVEAVELLADDTAVAVLAAGRLRILHVPSGTDLLEALPDGVSGPEGSPALGAGSRLALFWGEGFASLRVHGLRRGGDAEGERAA